MKPAWPGYEVLGKLAEGGMAELYLVRPHARNEVRVIKRPRARYIRDPALRVMFADEILVSSRMDHPNVVRTLEFDLDAEDAYIVLEYVDGVSLAKLIASNVAPMPVELVGFIVCRVLDALEYVHGVCDAEGQPLEIVHRDISPGNVLVGGRGEVKLSDFGIAQAAYRLQETTREGVLKGKIAYMAPEQLLNAADQRTDLYSVGVVLAETVVRRRLFRAKSQYELLELVSRGDLSRFDEVAATVPDDLEAVIRRALSGSVEDRFQTAAEFRAALEASVACVGPEEVGAYVQTHATQRSLFVPWGEAEGAVESEVSDVSGEVEIEYEEDSVAEPALRFVSYELAISSDGERVHGHAAASIESREPAGFVAATPRATRVFAELLRDWGWLTEAQVGLALDTSKDFGEPLTASLQRLGLMKPEAALERLIAVAPDNALADTGDGELATIAGPVCEFSARALDEAAGLIVRWVQPASRTVAEQPDEAIYASELSRDALTSVISALFPRSSWEP